MPRKATATKTGKAKLRFWLAHDGTGVQLFIGKPVPLGNAFFPANGALPVEIYLTDNMNDIEVGECFEVSCTIDANGIKIERMR